MDAQSMQSILQHIETADLTAAEYRAARRLLDRVSDQWTVYLSRADACAVCGVTTWPAARRVLNRLQEAGIIALHTNNRAYVLFVDRAETDHRRAVSARPDDPDPAEPRQNGSQARQNGASRAETDHRRAVSARLPRDWDQGIGKGREIDPLPSLPGLEGGTGETAPELHGGAPNRIDPDEQARSVRLLTDPDVGLSQHEAEQAAARYRWEAVRAQAFRFVRDRAGGKARSAGCIPRRLAQPDRFPADVTEADRATPLWARHHSEAETYAIGEAERRQKYLIGGDYAQHS